MKSCTDWKIITKSNFPDLPRTSEKKNTREYPWKAKKGSPFI